MGSNAKLGAAKIAKEDEFYTQYRDIEAEINAYVEYDPDVFRGKTILLPCDDPEWSNFTKYFAVNFERFGLKKLISTSYAKGIGNRQLTLFEATSPLFDKTKHDNRGKLFMLTHDRDGSGMIDTDDIEFSGYLEGDGDFRSPEVCKLRDEADIIITNPPFSQFRTKKGKKGFLEWILEAGKKFIIMGNKNAITYKEVFPLLMDNKMWVGFTSLNGGRWMVLPKDMEIKSNKAKDDGKGNKILNVAGVCWFTNIEHGKRHEQLLLDTMDHNLKYNKILRQKLEMEYGRIEYPFYDNYDALEVPLAESIPSDYDGVMGVPITFFDKYNPEQFEIIDITKAGAGNPATKTKKYPRQVQIGKDGKQSTVTKLNDGANIVVSTPPADKTYYIVDNVLYVQTYPRILIRPKKGGNL